QVGALAASGGASSSSWPRSASSSAGGPPRPPPRPSLVRPSAPSHRDPADPGPTREFAVAMTIASAHQAATADLSGEDRNYAPAVYGSLLVATLVAVQWRAEAVPELIGLTLVTSVAVFWLAHAWSEI